MQSMERSWRSAAHARPKLLSLGRFLHSALPPKTLQSCRCEHVWASGFRKCRGAGCGERGETHDLGVLLFEHVARGVQDGVLLLQAWRGVSLTLSAGPPAAALSGASPRAHTTVA